MFHVKQLYNLRILNTMTVNVEEYYKNERVYNMFTLIYKRFIEAYHETFLKGDRGKKATLDMINLASASFRLYIVDLINDNEMSMIRYYYHYIGTCAESYGLEDLWTCEVL